MKIITSRTNPEIKSVHELHQAKHRKTQQKFIAEGIRTCTTLQESGITLETIYVTEPLVQHAHIIAPKENVIVVSTSVMEKISTTTTPSGMLGVFEIPKLPTPAQLTSGIVLTHISNPGNMGTLIRSAAAMNANSVVIIEGVDPWSPKVIQASAGTIGYITIFQWSWENLLKHKESLNLIALVVKGGKQPHEVSFTNSLLVIGSEAHGIPSDWINDCDIQLTLPMPGKTESLNAAVAGSIALYLSILVPH